MIIIDIIVMGFIVWGSAMINIWFVSQIVCSIIYGIPKLLKLKRRGFLNKKASVFSYIFTILFNGLLCFGLYKLLEGNISAEWLFAYEIGLFISIVLSLSKRNKKFTYQDIMYAQRYNHGEIINELFELSKSVSKDVFDIVNNSSVYISNVCKKNETFLTNANMIHCFDMCLDFCINHDIVENEEESRFLLSALMVKLSDMTSTDYSAIENYMYEIFSRNQSFNGKEINEEMRKNYVLSYISSLVFSDTFQLYNRRDEIMYSYKEISNLFFSIVLGKNVDKCDNMGITLAMTSSVLKNVLKKNSISHEANKKIKKEKIIDVQEDDDFFKEEFEFSYAKVKKVLKKIGFDSYATFKKHVYDSKKIERKKFDNKEEEIDYLVQAEGYENFEDFYNTNMEID